MDWNANDRLRNLDQQLRRHQGFMAGGIMLLGIAWACLVHFRFPLVPEDDAFIIFRYVENFLQGKGLVYNEGQRVFGVTTPLYLMLLIILKTCLPWAALPAIALYANMFFFCLTGIAIFLVMNRITHRMILSAVIATVFLVNRDLLVIASGGMETYLFTSLVLFAFLTIRHPLRYGLMAALATLCRPEGILLLPICLQAHQKSLKNLKWIAAGYLSVMLPWVIFAWLYYGSPIPHSVIAKAKPLYPLPQSSALFESLKVVGVWFLGQPIWKLHRFYLITAIIVIGLGIIAVQQDQRKEPCLWLPPSFFLLILLFYGLGNPLLFEWYFPLLLIPAFLGGILGLESLKSFFATNFSFNYPRLGRFTPILVSCVMYSWLTNLTIIPYLTGASHQLAPVRELVHNPLRLRIGGYREAAQFLNEQARPSDRVAAPEIGALGYYYQGRILDACGLVSPEALPFIPAPPNQQPNPRVGVITNEFVLSTRPEWVVAHPFFTQHSLLRSAEFARQYQLARTIRLGAPVWGSTAIQVFHLKEMPQK